MKRILSRKIYKPPNWKIGKNIIFYDDETLNIESINVIFTEELLKYEKENTWAIRNNEEESKYIDLLLNQGEIESRVDLINFDLNSVKSAFNREEILKNWGNGKEFKYWENNYKNLSENIKLLKRLKNIKTLDI